MRVGWDVYCLLFYVMVFVGMIEGVCFVFNVVCCFEMVEIVEFFVFVLLDIEC